MEHSDIIFKRPIFKFESLDGEEQFLAETKFCNRLINMKTLYPFRSRVPNVFTAWATFYKSKILTGRISI